MEKTVQAMVELKMEGKIKYLGLSECSAATLRRACAVHHIAAIQVEYSPFATDIEDPQIDVLRTAREVSLLARMRFSFFQLTLKFSAWCGSRYL